MPPLFAAVSAYLIGYAESSALAGQLAAWACILFFPALGMWTLRNSPGCVAAIFVITALGVLLGVATGVLARL